MKYGFKPKAKGYFWYVKFNDMADNDIGLKITVDSCYIEGEFEEPELGVFKTKKDALYVAHETEKAYRDALKWIHIKKPKILNKQKKD